MVSNLLRQWICSASWGVKKAWKISHFQPCIRMEQPLHIQSMEMLNAKKLVVVGGKNSLPAGEESQCFCPWHHSHKRHREQRRPQSSAARTGHASEFVLRPRRESNAFREELGVDHCFICRVQSHWYSCRRNIRRRSLKLDLCFLIYIKRMWLFYNV